MNRPLPHTWCHTAFWLLSLGVLWVSLPCVTPSFEEICKAHAEDKFQIRAMTYTAEHFYLVSSTGHLFVEDAKTFKANLKATPPTIHLNNPQIDKLPSDWDGDDPSVNYADNKVQFGFTFKFDDHSEQHLPIFTLVKYSGSKSGGNLKMCIHLGYQMDGQEKPLHITHNSTECENLTEKYAFWLNFKLSSMFPVQRNTTLKIEFSQKMEKLFRKLNVTFDKKIGDSISDIKRKRKPQSGLYVKNVGILLTTNTSTVELQAYPIRSQVMKNKEWPIRKFLKLKQCETFFDDFGWEEGVCLSGAAILITLGLCFFVGQEKMFWRQAKEETKKPGHGKMPDIFSSVISSTIHNSTLIESPQSPVNPEPKKKSKKKHRKKRRKKNISLAKVRESQIKSKVAATSKTSQKRSQVVSSGVSPRSTVSSAITELRKSLVSLKRSSKLPSRMSLRSSPTDAQ